MELKEFMKKVQKDPVIRSSLPMNQGMLYPAFAIRHGSLCALFLCHKSGISPEGLLLWPGEYAAAFRYPQGALVSFQDLKYHPDFEAEDFTVPSLLPNRTPEEKLRYKEAAAKLQSLARELLDKWDAGQTADPAEYNAVLWQVLTQAQAETYRKLLGDN